METIYNSDKKTFLFKNPKIKFVKNYGFEGFPITIDVAISIDNKKDINYFIRNKTLKTSENGNFNYINLRIPFIYASKDLLLYLEMLSDGEVEFNNMLVKEWNWEITNESKGTHYYILEINGIKIEDLERLFNKQNNYEIMKEKRNERNNKYTEEVCSKN